MFETNNRDFCNINHFEKISFCVKKHICACAFDECCKILWEKFVINGSNP
jgi:hypothetical protein